MRKTILLLASIALAVLLASGLALAAAGDLDPSFGEGGKWTNRGPTVVNAAALQPDGKIIVAGWSGRLGYIPRRTSADFALIRLLPEGTLDSSFGEGGMLTTNMGAGRGGDSSIDDFDRLSDVLVQPDGKIVAAGDARSNDRTGDGNHTDIALVRYKPDGTLDKAFGGGDGKVFTDPVGIDSSSANAVLRQPNGKLVVAGSADGRSLLVRYLADGSRDKSFGGGDGIVTTRFGGQSHANDLVLRPDGQLIALGSSVKRNSAGQRDYNFALARYNRGGALDSSFGGGDGKATTDFGSRFDYGRALVLLSDGKLVAAGAAGWRDRRFAIARFGPRGALDKTFGGGDGKVTTNLSGVSSAADDLVVQPDGKLVMAGSAGNVSSNDFALVRYQPDGVLDDSFGGDGTVLTDFGDPQQYDDEYASALVRQGDGKIVAVGNAYYDDDQDVFSHAAVARYLAE